MGRVIHFYMDDSGSRHPDRKPNPSAHGNDWFALGGILIHEEDEVVARDLYHAFCQKWGVDYPLHSVDIRAKSKRFHWLTELDSGTLDEFFESLNDLAISMPVIGIACVIDRPGYNARYRAKYGRQRWSLCKTAFCIVVERAVKYASARGYKLRVSPERCNKKDDDKLSGYYTELRDNGQPFSSESSAKYKPLETQNFHDSLHEFRVKDKTDRDRQENRPSRSPRCHVDLARLPSCLTSGGAGRLALGPD